MGRLASCCFKGCRTSVFGGLLTSFWLTAPHLFSTPRIAHVTHWVPSGWLRDRDASFGVTSSPASTLTNPRLLMVNKQPRKAPSTHKMYYLKSVLVLCSLSPDSSESTIILSPILSPFSSLHLVSSSANTALVASIVPSSRLPISPRSSWFEWHLSWCFYHLLASSTPVQNMH